MAILYSRLSSTAKIIDIYQIHTYLHNQYDLPQNTRTFAAYPQWKHLLPSDKGSASKGTHNVFAWPVNWVSPSVAICFDSIPLLSLIFYSHCLLSHQGVRTTFLSFKLIIKSYHLSAFLIFASNLDFAFSYIPFWISFKNRGIFSVNWSQLDYSFSPLYLNTHTTFWLSTSLGPIYILIGTPFNYQWLYFHPGV